MIEKLKHYIDNSPFGADVFIQVDRDKRIFETEFNQYKLSQKEFEELYEYCLEEIKSRPDANKRYAIWEIQDHSFKQKKNKRDVLLKQRSDNYDRVSNRAIRKQNELFETLSWIEKLNFLKRQMRNSSVESRDLGELFRKTEHASDDDLTYGEMAFKDQAKRLDLYNWYNSINNDGSFNY